MKSRLGRDPFKTRQTPGPSASEASQKQAHTQEKPLPDPKISFSELDPLQKLAITAEALQTVGLFTGLYLVKRGLQLSSPLFEKRT